MSLYDFILKCHKNLIDHPDKETSIAIEYLTNRNLLIKTIISCKIGYCSLAIDIPESVKFYGQDNSEENKKWDMSSYIAGKLIVPIFSEFGKVVGFATRTPSTSPGNTWWNIPFKKSNHLFLLNFSRKEIFNKNKIYLVEGYMDALVLYQNGLKNIACIMGTALTTRKIGLICRYCNNVCLCFDTDKNEAGQNAQKIAIAILKKFDFCENISVISDLPIGEDPDVFVTKYGIDSFLSKEKNLNSIDIKKICEDISAKRKKVAYAQ